MTFGAVSGSSALVIDSDGSSGPSPMQAVAMGFAGCMAIDVITILQKGRHPVTALRVVSTSDRAEDPPRRFTRIHLTFHVTGNVPAQAVERAVALSRDTYCSVWHSLRQDIELTTTIDVHP